MPPHHRAKQKTEDPIVKRKKYSPVMLSILHHLHTNPDDMFISIAQGMEVTGEERAKVTRAFRQLAANDDVVLVSGRRRGASIRLPPPTKVT